MMISSNCTQLNQDHWPPDPSCNYVSNFMISASIDIFIIYYVFYSRMSSEIIKCRECGHEFDTLDSLKEHEKIEQEDKELQNICICIIRNNSSRFGIFDLMKVGLPQYSFSGDTLFCWPAGGTVYYYTHH
jgi:hypothetical protein